MLQLYIAMCDGRLIGVYSTQAKADDAIRDDAECFGNEAWGLNSPYSIHSMKLDC